MPRTVPRLTGQVRTVLEHMKRKGSITNMEAQTVHRIRALPRRISDLEELGYIIVREWRTDPVGQRYVRYTLDFAEVD